MINGAETTETLKAENEQLRQRVEELERSKTRFERFFNLSLDMFCILSFDGTFTLLNPACEHILGYPPDELCTQPFISLVHPDDCAETAAQLQEARMGHAVSELQHRYRRNNGTYTWLEWDFTTLPDEELIFATARDISERKRTEIEHERLNDALQCQANELRIFKTLIENMPDGVGVVNGNGTAVYANPALFRIHDYGKTQIGIDMSGFFPPELGDHIPDIFQEIFRKIATQGIWQGEIMGKRKDGSDFVVLASNFLISDDNGAPNATVGIVRDITEHKRAEQERAELKERIIEAQQATLRELSTPLLPIANHMIVMPLVGAIDTIRASDIMENLLEGVAAHQATIVILDITGVKQIDTQTASVLIQTAQAVNLLGAQVVLTGIGPQIAQALVHLEVDLSTMITRSDLQSGIAYALHARQGGNNRQSEQRG
jgi:PAS domain S-box-containing protein